MTTTDVLDQTLTAVRDAVTIYDGMLARLEFVQGVDEIALYFSNKEVLQTFVAAFVSSQKGVLFNIAKDHVHTLPLRTCYDANYFFLRMNDLPNVRIEAMTVGAGVSPLHVAHEGAMALQGSAMAIVHASFKVDDEEDYAVAVDRLRKAGWEPAQRCESNYGRFSYWTPLDRSDWYGDIDPLAYLKPRVNLRDEAQPLA